MSTIEIGFIYYNILQRFRYSSGHLQGENTKDKKSKMVQLLK
jgi:hypothetical protein